MLLLAALAASMLAPCGEIAAQWRPINFVDEFGDSGGRGASSAPVRSIQPMRSPYEGTTARIWEIFYSLAQAAVLVEQWRREYNTVRPHSACGGFPPAPEAIKPSPWFLRMPVLHGPPQVLGLT